MRDRNNCNPQLGQRRLAIGGNGDGSNLFGCGMTHSLLIQAGAQSVSQSPTPIGSALVGDFKQ